MKRGGIIVFVFVVIAILAISHLSFGLFHRYNFITAYVDKWSGTERIIVYGELLATDSIKSVMAPRLGFHFERKANCPVTDSFVRGVNDYNKIMSAAISSRLGEKWETSLEKEFSGK